METTAARIKAITATLKADPELLARVERLLTPPPTKGIAEAYDASLLFADRMAGLASEELHAAYLTRRNTVLHVATLTRGNDAHTIVDPRQVLREAVRLGAAAIVVAHNHPSGDPTPSLADVEVTQRLVDAGRILGIEVLDHLIMTDHGGWRSMREEGLIAAQPGRAFMAAER
jgi:DNA repair protein RadC